MPTTLTSLFLVLTVLLVLSPSGTYAFGAGDIPDFAYLQNKAFRHGDIESIIENLVKHAGGAAIGGGSLLGFATSVLKAATGGSKFNKIDVKRVYFGNWLRDYSQAMDIAGLSKLTPDTITLIVAVLGFMTFGFATREFEVTQDRLGVYLPVEHIDNPKGYAETEGDARRIHPKLRPPVNLRELEIDERTGMKKYMASEGEGWDTSTAFIRRTLTACIEHGRRAGGKENADLFEAFRLLGTGLHTLEDLLAHSNWCEVALRKMGHEEVFCHVGDNVIVDTPNGPAPPLVTGTFGGADFLHSLIGEAGDKLSQASVTDLASKMDQASQGGDSNVNALKAVLGKLPIGGNSDKMNKTDEMHKQSKAYHFDPNNIAPPEVQRQLLDVLKWRDSIMRDVTEGIDMVPGLSDLIDEFTNAMNAFVYTVLAPYVVPMITQASGILDEGSQAVINNEDQYRVFDDLDASDPSHSILSKDHFALILNEPAGKIAQLVVEHSVNLIVRAWSDNSNPDSVLDTILEAFHHPYYATGNSQIQHQMFEHMERWLGGLGPDEAGQVVQRLTKESVREHKNKRIGSEDMDFQEAGYGGCSHSASHRPQGSSHGYQQQSSQHSNSGGGYSSGAGYSSATYGGGRSQYEENTGYGGQSQTSQGYGSGGREGSGRRQPDDNDNASYGGRYGQQGGYGDGRHGETESASFGGGYGQESSYGGGHRQQEHRSRRDDSEYSHSGPGDSYGGVYQQESNQSFGGGYSQDTYSSSRRETEAHGRHKRDDDENRTPYGGGYEQESYSGGHSRGGHSERQENQGYGYGGSSQSYGSGRDDGEGHRHRHRQDGDDSEYTSGDNRRSEYGRSEGYSTSSYGQSGGYVSRSEGYSTSSYGQSGGYVGRSEGYGENSGGSSGYNPSYGGDETYGVERLNVRGDDSDDNREGKHHGHSHHRKHSDD